MRVIDIFLPVGVLQVLMLPYMFLLSFIVIFFIVDLLFVWHLIISQSLGVWISPAK